MFCKVGQVIFYIFCFVFFVSNEVIKVSVGCFFVSFFCLLMLLMKPISRAGGISFSRSADYKIKHQTSIPEFYLRRKIHRQFTFIYIY